MSSENKVRVFSAFPGMGKSYASNFINSKDPFVAKGIVAVDIDSADWHWVAPGVENPNWKSDYFNAIKYTLSHTCVGYVFVSTHEDTRKFLREAGIPYEIVVPSLSESYKAQYIQRLKNRGSNENLIAKISDNYEKWITDILKEETTEHPIHIMNDGQFIIDLIYKDLE